MASLEDRLRRTDWDPQPDDTLIGTIVKISERETQYGRYPLLVVGTDDGTEYNVHCTRGGLKTPVVAQRPNRGDRIGIRYDGPVSRDGGKDAHRYNVVFENENEAEPDWDRIAESQQQNRAAPVAGNGDTPPNGDNTTTGIASPSSVNKTWGKDPDPWGATAETPAPF